MIGAQENTGKYFCITVYRPTNRIRFNFAADFAVITAAKLIEFEVR